MQEFLILIDIAIILFFIVYGHQTKGWASFFIVSFLFLVLGIGLFSTGWERYEGHFHLSDLNSSDTDVSPIATIYTADLTTNPVIYGIAMFSIILSIATLGYGISERMKNQEAKKKKG